MKVVILCGGEGVRYKNLDHDVPKVLGHIGDKPILWHIMKFYASYGFNEFVLCLGNYHDQIKDFFSGESNNWTIDFVDTGLNTPTGGRVKLIESYIQEDNFLVTYGDGLCDVDLNKLIEFHLNHGKIATITAIRPFNQYGVMELGQDDKVLSFEEKPRMEQYVNGGYFVFSRAIFGYLEISEDLESSLFNKLIGNQELKAFRHEGFWKSMDTVKENVQLNELWDEGRAAWVRK